MIGYLLLTSYIGLFSWILGYSYHFHHHISRMTGMMTAMTVGMVFGLGIGTTFSLLFPGSFFQVTFISSLIASTLGFVSGLPFSLTAVLDGFLAGIMGGMMGTMLGVMLPVETVNQALQLVALFTAGSLFILFLLIISEVTARIKHPTLSIQPLPFFLALLLFLALSHQYSLPTIEKQDRHSFNLVDTKEMK